MKKLNSIKLMLFFAFVGIQLNAQVNPILQRKFGLETELIQPFVPNVGIMKLVATIRLTNAEKEKRGDLLLGAFMRPNVTHDIVEKIDEYLLITGYRQYFWKGLHAEARSNLGYSWGKKNLIDGKDYNNLSWFWEVNAGYKFNFAKKSSFNLYAIAQAGIISSISANIGPRGGKPDTFIQGNLLVGINF
jgi:hypothetical protein